jgi:hypothetical protein
MAIFVLIKLRESLTRTNKLVVHAFSVCLLLRFGIYIYCYYTLKDKQIVSDGGIHDGNLDRTRYILNNNFNFVMVLIFYIIILKMKNFWNTIMFDKIENILKDMKKSKSVHHSQAEFDNLVAHLEIY